MADGIDAWPAVGNGSQQQGGGQGVEFSEWHKIGMDNGWCGPTVCTTHDGLPPPLRRIGTGRRAESPASTSSGPTGTPRRRRLSRPITPRPPGGGGLHE